MAYELFYLEAADVDMAAIEADPAREAELAAVNRTLDQLEQDPFAPRLGSTAFKTVQGAGISATPVRGAPDPDHFVLWQRGAHSGEIEIVAIASIPTS